MQKAVTIVLALSLLGITAAHNCAVRSYATKLVLACDPNEIYIKWPNYEDASTYHQCQGVGRSRLINCPVGQVYAHVQQGCVTCDRYIPAVECRSLPTQRPPVCVNIDGSGQNTSAPPAPGATYPTPHYPNSTPGDGGGNSSGTDDPNGEKPTDDPNGNNPTDDPSGNNPTEDTNEPEDFPGPPSPPSVTNDPNVPTPPTALPTPPEVNGTPPHVG